MQTDTKLNILMVEDNRGDEFLLSELLNSSGLSIHIVYKAGRISEAVSLLQQYPVDIILLDLSLPDASGIDSFKSMRKAAVSIPIIILSGLTDMKVALDAINLGAQDYLIKGDFDEKLLAKTIRYSLERMRSLYELKESNERYNLISKATNDMVWDWDLVTGSVYRNKEGWKKIFGVGEKESELGLIDDWDSRIHPEDEGKVKLVNEEIRMSVKDFFEVECRMLKYDGTYAYIHDRGNIIRDQEGKAVRLLGATQDITERKKAEEILKTSEERYRYLFNNNPASVFIWDIDNFQILEVNDTAVGLYGYCREEFLAKTVLDLCLPEDHDEIKQFASTARQRSVFRSEITSRHINKPGEEMYMNISSHRIQFKGRPAILALATNITDKVSLETELEKERFEKQKEITDAVISAQEQERQEIGGELHDNIIQILAGSLLYLGLAKKELKNDQPFLTETETLISTAIKEIRDLSHSLIPPSLHESELMGAINHIIEVTQQTSGMMISLQAFGFDENSVPDKLKLNIYRIIQEQFNNILKHAQAQKVIVRLASDNEKTVLSIKDDGVGFDTSKKANGVGLMNIKTRASLFNGEVSIISSPEKGCELKVLFN